MILVILENVQSCCGTRRQASSNETLDVTAPALSQWPNRILARSGRKVVREKLRNFVDRYGITFAEVKPARDRREDSGGRTFPLRSDLARSR